MAEEAEPTAGYGCCAKGCRASPKSRRPGPKGRRAVPQNYTLAVRWTHKAAEQGNAGAQYNIGCLYAQGRRVPQDYVQAHMWLNLAASRASGDEQKAYAGQRDFLAGKMTAQQIAEAQRFAREWKPSAEIRTDRLIDLPEQSRTGTGFTLR
ncbi:MAG: tetratricopeptide repeat protein [Bryobacteraceae bacterium]